MSKENVYHPHITNKDFKVNFKSGLERDPNKMVGVSHFLEETCLGECIGRRRKGKFGNSDYDCILCKPLWMPLRFGV